MKENNIIDLSQRRIKGARSIKLSDIRARIDLEQAKLLVTTSLVSVLFLVTLANKSLMSAPDVAIVSHTALDGEAPTSGRAIASVPTGTSDWEDEMVARVAKMSLSETEKVGRRPSSLDRLALEFLEGNYAVRLENGKLRELEYSSTAKPSETPKQVINRGQFLQDHRDLLPVSFTEPVLTDSAKSGEQVVESYDLMTKSQVPAAKVEFHLDSAGRLLSMKVIVSRLAAN